MKNHEGFTTRETGISSLSDQIYKKPSGNTQAERDATFVHKSNLNSKRALECLNLNEDVKKKIKVFINYLETRTTIDIQKAKISLIDKYTTFTSNSDDIDKRLKERNDASGRIRQYTLVAKDIATALESKSPKDIESLLQREDIKKILTYIQDSETRMLTIPHRNFRASLNIDKLERQNAATTIAEMMIKGNAGFFFDIDHTLIDPREGWIMPQRWTEDAKVAKTILNDGIIEGLITARPIEGADQALKNGNAGQDFIDTLEICGEHDDVSRGPITNGIKKLNKEKAERHTQSANNLMNTIKQNICENTILNDYMSKGLIPEISLTYKALGGLILGGSVAVNALKRHVQERHTIDNTIQVDKIVNTVYSELNKIASAVVDNYPDFEMKATRERGFDIQLNQNNVDLKSNKGDAVYRLAKHYKLICAIMFGDDKPDLDMAERTQLMVAFNNTFKDRQNDVINTIFSKLEQNHGIKLADEQRKTIIENKREIKELLFPGNKTELQGTELQDYVFVGVNRTGGMPSVKEVSDVANVMVNGTGGTLDLVHEVVQKIQEMKTNQE